MSSHPSLRWPRSDGDRGRWPPPSDQVKTRPGGESWHEPLHPADKKWDLYRGKIGEYLVKKLNLPMKASVATIDLPDGYALFGHNKWQSDGAIRTDVYLFGSINTLKFRSPAEFFEHAAWLFDTKRPLSDHSLCECKYNKNSALAQAKASSSFGAGPSKRPNVSLAKDAKRQKLEMSEMSSDEDEGTSGIVLERQVDMKSGRRFRRGELIWFRVPTMKPPAEADGLPSITHWPGLVANIVAKTRALPDPTSDSNGTNASASMSVAWSIAGGVAPKSLKPVQPKFVTYYEYHLRPLGFFSSGDELLKMTRELLPWSVGKELLGGVKGWERLGKEGTRVIAEGTTREVAEENGAKTGENSVDESWKRRWGRRIPFKDMAGDWDTRVFRLAIALKVAAAITDSWTQTDKIEVVAGANVDPNELSAILDQRKTLYQGLWWGGERIWIEDMVRLKKHRSELPSDTLLTPSSGAEERAVLLCIRTISLEVSPDQTTELKTAWRCLLFGDVYEVASREDKEETSKAVSIEMRDGELPLVPSHPAPPDCEYRRLNDSEVEVTVDVLDIAGRAYPDLLDHSTQDWFQDPNTSSKEDTRVNPGDSARALTGLLPGTLVASHGRDWKEDLYVIASEANKGVEKQMKKYYESQLKKARDISVSRRDDNGAIPKQSVEEGREQRADVPMLVDLEARKESAAEGPTTLNQAMGVAVETV